MMYRDVIQGYAAVRQASSREWMISASLVMCVELDMSMDAYLEVPASSSRNQRGPQFLRITVFRQASGRWMPRASAVGAPATPEERSVIEHYQSLVRRWIEGQVEELPGSTSTVIADRLRGQR